jgi:hypothetical protein
MALLHEVVRVAVVRHRLFRVHLLFMLVVAAVVATAAVFLPVIWAAPGATAGGAPVIALLPAQRRVPQDLTILAAEAAAAADQATVVQAVLEL